MTFQKEAKQQGLAQRAHFGRSSLADLPKRKFDPLDVLSEASRKHIARLLPVKFKLMSESPFAFFRGSVEIMAADLGHSPHTKIEVQMCGDAHVKNFGFFATPGSEIVLDINDFDETQRGPWEWDVKRLAASIILAGRIAGDREACCKDAVRLFVSEYCEWIRRFAEMPAIEIARHRIFRDLHDPAIRSALKKAERSTPLSNLQKLARKGRDGYRFIYKRDSLWDVKGPESQAVVRALAGYRATLAPDRQFLFDHYTVADVGFKVVGTGSVGLRDYVLLLLGRDTGEKDPLFLQIKEEQPSAYARYYKDHSVARHQGERVVLGQRAVQVFSDLLLGWCSIAGRDYLVRQLSDHKSSVEPEELKGDRLVEYGRVCAELLAKGHARSGDPAVLAAYLGRPGKAEKALCQFALAYADRVENDYDAFRKAFKKNFTREAMKLARKS
ncbi:MAG TPA: DUF2252 domain-containing protein [Candidatus Angelobacter sp.]|nr:DUF2252 domain-containing protein [Candidatus Angelobacter sp.]